ncbi:tRNA epoxyqueuosine(34) reductase QueG [Aestuariivirga litoralis]|uniref:tRNA epoxyqueuosine(34) reductase QueG n=1 Tax=Aestuariivirga litoralis TaxID=2650924 RepID=UPI001FE09A8C|nr:tRNA epoxyqueuosine(34) reductase QueG [Aestuariivirga litoralis]
MKTLRQELGERASGEGFSATRIVTLGPDAQQAERLSQFITEGRHGSMAWMAETEARRASPQAMWPEARTAIVFAQSYGQDLDPLERLADRESGVISVYALNRDYHDVVKGKLKRIAQWLARRTGADVKVFVDTAPLMEKPLAQKAGLGWQGKHTNLVSRELGSWFFIGTILTTAEIEADAAEADHCGSCRACLDICPTKAFPAPYQLDARRCISYLTIEHAGHIDREFRVAMGNRIYGCDDCLAACPWNKFAAAAREAKLLAREDLKAPRLGHLLALEDAAFRALFTGSPVKRTGRDRFIRNVLIAAGNSGDKSLVPQVTALLDDPAPIVRAMAVWAMSRLLGEPDFAQLRTERTGHETDADVRREWETA